MGSRFGHAATFIKKAYRYLQCWLDKSIQPPTEAEPSFRFVVQLNIPLYNGERKQSLAVDN